MTPNSRMQPCDKCAPAGLGRQCRARCWSACSGTRRMSEGARIPPAWPRPSGDAHTVLGGAGVRTSPRLRGTCACRSTVVNGAKAQDAGQGSGPGPRCHAAPH
jgi:hypothetical protein